MKLIQQPNGTIEVQQDKIIAYDVKRCTEVTDALEAGWELYGHPFYSHGFCASVQAVVLREKQAESEA
jgi:hypothetical protein